MWSWVDGKGNFSANISKELLQVEHVPHDPDDVFTPNLGPLIILGVLIVVISGLIILSFILNKELRQRPANIMIFSQACTDTFTALVFIPLNLVHNSTTMIVSMFLGCYMLYLSLLNLLLISVDRYLALNRPFLHRKVISVKNTIKMLIVVWLAPFGIVLIPLSWWFSDSVTRSKATNIYICTIWSLMLVLVVLMTVLYVMATKGAKQTIRNRRISVSSITKDQAAVLAQKELRVVHLFGLLLFFFLLAYLPILYINFCFIIGAEKYSPQELETVSLYLLICNSVLNPTICIILKKDYLHCIKRMIPCMHDDYTLTSMSETWSLASYGSEPNLRRRTSNGTLGSSCVDINDRLRRISSHHQLNDRVRSPKSPRSPKERRRSSHGHVIRCTTQIQSARIRKSRSPMAQMELMELNNLIVRKEYLISRI